MIRHLYVHDACDDRWDTGTFYFCGIMIVAQQNHQPSISLLVMGQYSFSVIEVTDRTQAVEIGKMLSLGMDTLTAIALLVQ